MGPGRERLRVPDTDTVTIGGQQIGRGSRVRWRLPFVTCTGPSTPRSPKIMSVPVPKAERPTSGYLIEKWSAEKESVEASCEPHPGNRPEGRKLMEANRAKVAGALPEGTVLVEFVRFIPSTSKPYPPKDSRTGSWPRDPAFVLLPDRQPDNIQMIDT